MVPNDPTEIAPAIDAALQRLMTQLRADIASCGESSAKGHADGAALLTALADSADEVRRRLIADPPSTAANPNSSTASENNEGADHDER